jgi:MFS family permease
MSQNTTQQQTNPYIPWLIATAFVVFQFFLQNSSSLMNEYWAKDFHLSNIQVSNLSAAFFYTYVLMQVPVGVLYDRFNTKKILFIAAILLAIGCILLALSPNYAIAVIARFLMGTGASFGYIGMLKVVLDNFKANKFTLILGIGETISMICITLGIIALGFFLKTNSWRTSMFICGIFAILLAIAIKTYLRDKPQQPNIVPLIDIMLQIKSLILNKQVILCSIYGFFAFSIFNAFTSLWGVSFLTNTYHYAPELAASMVSIVFMGVGVGAPMWGFLSKIYGNHLKIMLISAIGLTIVNFFIIIIPGLNELMMFSMLFLSGLFCSGYLQAFTIVKDSVDPKLSGTALAFANMVLMAGAPIFQIFVATLLQSNIFNLSTADNYRFSLAIIPLGTLLCIALCYYIKEPQKHVIKTEFNI